MRKFLLIGLVSVASVFAAPVITVIPTLGPDVFTAPGSTFDDWSTNVIANLRNPAAPDGSGVATYVPLANGATLNGGEFIITPFQSWQGVAPGPYSNQLGTVLYFSVKIIAGPSETFSLSQLGAAETYLGQAQPPYPPGSFTTFNPTRLVGVKSGGGDTTGADPNTTLLTELYYVGLGFGQPLDPSAVGSDQDKINTTIAEIQALSNKTTQVSYTLGLNSGLGSVNVSAVSGIPEPGTWALMGVGLAGLAFLRRRSA